MHAADHPQTTHLQYDVFRGRSAPEATGGRPVGLLWASPDCKHFSKAKGGKPRSKKIRSLAWVVVKWATVIVVVVVDAAARHHAPNVEGIRDVGPLGPDNQPCPKRRGQPSSAGSPRCAASAMRSSGRNCARATTARRRSGSGSSSSRVATAYRSTARNMRRGKPASPGSWSRRHKLLPWRTAADCLDFSLPCRHLPRKEEGRAIGVAPAGQRHRFAASRAASKRFVLDAAEAIIVPDRGVNCAVSAGIEKACLTDVAAGNRSFHR